MKTCIVIPARYDSTRLPGKVLLDIAGKPMIQWVYERASLIKQADKIIIATDNDLVYKTCSAFGAECIMTSNKHVSGTDRIGEAAEQHSDYDYFINIQADEPLIDPHTIDEFIEFLTRGNEKNIATLITEIENENDLFDFNVVKVVFDKNDKALFFSRNAIPANRDKPFKNWLAAHHYFRHIGVYGFKRETLLKLIRLSSSALERIESLEQLRWLENGYNIHCLKTDNFQIGVDTEADLDRIRNIMSLPLY